MNRGTLTGPIRNLMMTQAFLGGMCSALMRRTRVSDDVVWDSVVDTAMVFDRATNLPWAVRTIEPVFRVNFLNRAHWRVLDRCRNRSKHHVSLEWAVAAPVSGERPMHGECFRRMRRAIEALSERSWTGFSRRRRRLALIAVRMLRLNWTVRQAGEVFGFPKSTLNDWDRFLRRQFEAA